MASMIWLTFIPCYFKLRLLFGFSMRHSKSLVKYVFDWLSSFNIVTDHFDNGDRFKYSFMCILISPLGLVSVSVIE